MSQEVIERATALVNAFDARVQATPADKWSAASPCADWTARDVVVHVANNAFRNTAGITGEPAREVGADEDITAAWNDARDGFLTALTTGDLTKSVQGPIGAMSAADAIGRFMCMDILVHTWDLARATGGDERLDPAAVSGAYSGLKPMDAMIRMPGVFGPKVPAPEGADEQTEFLAFLGRQV